MTDAQIAHADNGIWCCATHGVEIDTNVGRGYSVETLRGWKQVMEEATRTQRTGHSTPGSGWIDRITIVKGLRFAPGATLQLGKVTVIEGGEPLGKSALFEWIASALGQPTTDRWREHKVALEIQFASPLPHRLQFESDGENHHYVIDAKTFHTPPSEFQIVHVPEDTLRIQYRDDLDMIARTLSVSRDVARGLAAEVRSNGSGYLSVLRFADIAPDNGGDEQSDERGPYVELRVTRAGERTQFEQSFASLATSEKYFTLIEFAAALARERSRTAPTLLLLDAGGWNLAEQSWIEVVRYLLSQPFQTALTPNIFRLTDQIWGSCARVRLRLQTKGDSKSPVVIKHRKQSSS